MQQSNGSMSLSKHRKAFGKTNRNKSNNILTAREVNKELEEKQARKKRLKSEMVGSIKELVKD